MNGFILGEKSTQLQTFNKKGERIPTTFILTHPCFVTYIKSFENEGYISVQLGFKQTKNCKKPVEGALKKVGIKTPLLFLREFRFDLKSKEVKVDEKDGKATLSTGEKKWTVGQEVKPSEMFTVGSLVNVSGVSKGKGFQGVVKRHAFKGGSKTHGQSDRERAPGSIGMTTTPGRVFKGKRMAGRMGNDRVTLKGLEVIELKDNGVLVKGLIPGALGGLIEVRNIE